MNTWEFDNEFTSAATELKSLNGYIVLRAAAIEGLIGVVASTVDYGPYLDMVHTILADMVAELINAENAIEAAIRPLTYPDPPAVDPADRPDGVGFDLADDDYDPDDDTDPEPFHSVGGGDLPF